MTKRSLTLILPLCAALAVACSSDGGLGPDPAADRRVLVRLEVAPSSSLLIAGDTRQLTIKAWDQLGTSMLDGADGEWADKATYTSSAPEIAGVSSSGLVTAVAPGLATITASLTVAGLTVTGSMTANVTDPITTKADPPPADSVTVTANQGSWSPITAKVWVGGTVTWVVPDGMQVGTMWFNVWDANAEKMEFIDGVYTRTFSTPGRYFYGTGGGHMWYEEGGDVEVVTRP